MSIDIEKLTFVDVSEERYGSFREAENIDAFFETTVGKAQLTSLKQEIVAQEAAQGNEGYVPSTDLIRSILINEQLSQGLIRQADISDADMIRNITYGIPHPHPHPHTQVKENEDKSIIDRVKDFFNSSSDPHPDPKDRISIVRGNGNVEVGDIDDGIHLIKTSEDRVFVVIKDEFRPFGYAGYGYLGVSASPVD